MISALTPALSPGRGRIVRRAFENYTTGLAGRSSAKPETSKCHFLSWGRGQKVRAGVKHNFRGCFLINISVFSVSSC